MIMLHGNIKRRILSILKSCNVNKQEIDQRQKSVDRLKAFECENSQEQFGISIGQGHIFCVRKFKM